MTHKVCTIPKFIAGGRFLVTPSTRLWKYMSLSELCDWFSIIFRVLRESMSDILFNIACVLGGQPPARSVATVCSVVHFTVCLSRFTKINSF